MTIQSLKEKLDAALDEYASEVKFNRETSSNHVSQHDIEELGRQTFYVLSKFRDIIVEHLKQN